MIKVGITGNIGSGKSFICSIFEKLGISVFQADKIAGELYYESEVRSKLEGKLGNGFYDENGSLIRANLSKRIFSDQEALRFVEELIHPLVRQRFIKWTESFSNDPYVLYEAAIMIETGHCKFMDKLIYVAADEQLRFDRICKRDTLSPEEIRKRMGNQWPDEEKIPLADFVINNNQEILLIPQVLSIHQLLINAHKRM
jgi:dephospho-CoA kinase